jgi:hypothetical protein
MKRDPARVFVFVLSFFSLLEGGASLLAHASSGASDFLSFIHKMNAVHGGLHVANGLVGVAFLLAGSRAAVGRFAMVFGLVYAALGVAGAVAHAGGHGTLGLGLIGPDHLLHIVIGLAGVVAARRSELNYRTVSAT